MTGGRTDKKIGEMNGWMATLFRVQLVATPVLATSGLALGTWLVQSVNDLARVQAVLTSKLDALKAEHYTRDAARADHLTLHHQIMTEVGEKFPPPFLTRQVDALERRVIALEEKQAP